MVDKDTTTISVLPYLVVDLFSAIGVTRPEILYFGGYMSLDRLSYEWKLHWKSMLLAPLALMVACILFALLQLNWKENIGRTYLSFAEVFLPLAAGVIAGYLVVREPAIELHLTVIKTYQRTSILRILMLIFTYGWICCLLISSMWMLHFWFLPGYLLAWPTFSQWLMAQLIWFVPLIWFVSVGMCIALITTNSTANAAILAAFWVIELLFWGPFHDTVWLRELYVFPTIMWIYQGDAVSLPAWYFNSVWLLPHIEQSGIALLLFVLNWFVLRNTEHLLKGTTAE